MVIVQFRGHRENAFVLAKCLQSVVLQRNRGTCSYLISRAAMVGERSCLQTDTYNYMHTHKHTYAQHTIHVPCMQRLVHIS